MNIYTVALPSKLTYTVAAANGRDAVDKAWNTTNGTHLEDSGVDRGELIAGTYPVRRMYTTSDGQRFAA